MSTNDLSKAIKELTKKYKISTLTDDQRKILKLELDRLKLEEKQREISPSRMYDGYDGFDGCIK